MRIVAGLMAVSAKQKARGAYSAVDADAMYL